MQDPQWADVGTQPRMERLMASNILTATAIDFTT